MEAKRSNLLLLGAGLLMGAGIGLLVLALFGLGGLRRAGASSSSAEVFTAPEIDQPAQDFELETLSGDKLRFADFHGQAVLVNFWATWCGPCRVEMPLIQSYAQRYPDDLVVLAVNNDEPRSTVQNYVDEIGLTFHILLDPGSKIADLYRVRAFPTSFFIDRDGKIRFQHIGVMNEDQLVRYLRGVGVGE